MTGKKLWTLVFCLSALGLTLLPPVSATYPYQGLRTSMSTKKTYHPRKPIHISTMQEHHKPTKRQRFLDRLKEDGQKIVGVVISIVIVMLLCFLAWSFGGEKLEPNADKTKDPFLTDPPPTKPPPEVNWKPVGPDNTNDKKGEETPTKRAQDCRDSCTHQNSQGQALRKFFLCDHEFHRDCIQKPASEDNDHDEIDGCPVCEKDPKHQCPICYDSIFQVAHLDPKTISFWGCHSAHTACVSGDFETTRCAICRKNVDKKNTFTTDNLAVVEVNMFHSFKSKTS